MYNETMPELKKPVIWILVADSKQAKIYVRKRAAGSEQELAPVGATLYAESSEIHETGRNRLGREFESAGSARHMSEPHADVGEEIRRHFAKAIATYLNAARAKREFNRLVLIVPAKLLGDLRPHLHKTVKLSVIAELSKDLTHFDNKALAAHLEDIA
jgi:protein required for attachment to host cells